MAVVIPKSGEAPYAALSMIAEKYGVLPAVYVDFLLQHDGAAPPENVVRLNDNQISIRAFLSSREILERSREIEGLQDWLMPIAEDASGNFFCIGAADHKVYFWDHEVDADQVVAASFAEFLESIQPLNLDDIELKPGQLKRVWVDPDFDPEF